MCPSRPKPDAGAVARVSLFAALVLLSSSLPARAALNPAPPAQPVKLVFVHHSTGENLLRNDYGGLGIALKTNHYFVSDTNYGWGPDAIGDRTDIPDWPEWFRSAHTTTIMDALYGESGQNSSYSRLAADPGGPNAVILFKSCFPNSNLEGNPADPPSPDGWLTVGHAKWVYNEILNYFRAHPEKLFVVLTAPPVQDATYASNARAFNQWLVNDWLAVNRYPFNNVAVFDFYNVLTDANAHHRYDAGSGLVEHAVVVGHNTSAYASSGGDDHPNVAGSQKATAEFVPLLNGFYNAWKTGCVSRSAAFYSTPALDGWVLESAENSGAGGSKNRSSENFKLGDDGANRQYRGILSFALNLPPNAVITAATLKMKRQSTTGTDPFTTHGRLLVDMRKRFFGAGLNFAIGDFQAAPTRSAVASFTVTPVRGWHKAVLTGAGIPFIKPNGVTQFRVRFTTDDNNDAGTDFVSFYSGNAAASNKPKLIIRYFTP